MCEHFSAEIVQARAAKGLTKWAELFASTLSMYVCMYIYIVALSGTIVM